MTRKLRIFFRTVYVSWTLRTSSSLKTVQTVRVALVILDAIGRHHSKSPLFSNKIKRRAQKSYISKCTYHDHTEKCRTNPHLSALPSIVYLICQPCPRLPPLSRHLPPYVLVMTHLDIRTHFLMILIKASRYGLDSLLKLTPRYII